MRRTRSDPIQFRLLLDDYAVLERLAADAGTTPKDYVIDLTLKRVATERRKKTSRSASTTSSTASTAS